MGGVPLVIDENTGEITATPNAVGQYLIGVCVEEYRDGVKIGETRRNFQYNVRICAFTNESTGALVYQWNFNFPNNDPAFISNEENPTFTFPAEGTYTVQLQAFRGTDECVDEFFQEITVITADIDADFDVIIGECMEDNNITLSLSNTSVDNSMGYVIVDAQWTVDQQGNVQSVTGLNADVDIDLSGADPTVSLVVTSSSGCTAEVSKTVSIDDLVAIGDFSFTADGCPSPELLQFTLTDLSSGINPTYTPISWDWRITSVEGTEILAGPTITLALDPFQVINTTLIVTFDNGCTAIVEKDINLENSLPEVDFEVTSVNCIDGGLANFVFEDTSNSIPGNPSNPTNWLWTITLADGTLINSDEQSVDFDVDPNQIICIYTCTRRMSR